MKIFLRRIEQNHAPLRKQPGKQQGKRAAQTFSRTIRLAQPGRYLGTGISQQRRRALDHRLNLNPKLHGSDGRIGYVTLAPPAFHRKWLRKSILREQRHMADLRQIVILGRQPEDRNAIHPRGRSLLRQLDRRQRLENRKQRPAKETDLLSRNRRQRSTSEPLNIRQSLRRSSPSSILPLENLANLAASRRIVNHALRFVLSPL